MSGDIFDYHKWGKEQLLESSGERPEMLPSILQCTGQASTTKNDPTQMSVVSRWRNPGLGLHWRYDLDLIFIPTVMERGR